MFVNAAFVPTAVLLEVVLLRSASRPIATLLPPITLLFNALLPIAVLLIPAVFVIKAE